jgi:hypothetical protein
MPCWCLSTAIQLPSWSHTTALLLPYICWAVAWTPLHVLPLQKTLLDLKWATYCIVTCFSGTKNCIHIFLKIRFDLAFFDRDWNTETKIPFFFLSAFLLRAFFRGKSYKRSFLRLNKFPTQNWSILFWKNQEFLLISQGEEYNRKNALKNIRRLNRFSG